MEIKVDEEKVEKINKYVKEGRFKNINEFIDKAIKLMLYAENKKDEFGIILPKKTSTENS